MSIAIQAQDLSKSQCMAGLRAALNILDKWKASCEQACRVLRISRSTYTRARKADSQWAVGLDADQMQRISLVLNIHAALRLVFDNPENVYGFPAMENRNVFFNGRAPLDIMAQGDMISLYETFRRIDALRGAQW
ncbi:antitoxin Xre-like helix-turn-helix domain-containing protein [Pseudomonas panipatensis]|uniref:antitoxin Xre-like helix-turn-helix domain-containing protein n=1 Tax=Pseudomonas panipatensis TaxID=428992 RepID=UPI0035B2D6FE